MLHRVWVVFITLDRTWVAAQVLAVTLVMVAIVLPTKSLSADSPSTGCQGAADCFTDGVRALKKGDRETALFLLRELIQNNPNTPWAGRAALVLGRYFKEQGDRQAITYLLSVPSQLPILGDYAYYYLGETLFLTKDWNGAATAYDLVNARYPDSLLRPQALQGSIEAWFQGEDCRRSRDRQTLFYSNFARHALLPAVLLRQGDCEQKSGDITTSAATFRRVWTHFASSPQSIEAAYRLQALKEKGVVLPELTAQDWSTRAKVLFEGGQYPLAVAAYQEVLKFNQGIPDRPQALLNLAIARVRLKQYDDAQASLGELVRNRAGSISQEATLWLARVYLRQNYDEPFLALAREVETGLLSGETKAKFLLLLALQHTEQGRLNKALAAYREAAETKGANGVAAEALWQIGWLAYKDGRYTDAVHAFDESRRAQPVGTYAVAALYWKARSLDKAGDKVRAVEAVRGACSEAPNSYYCQRGRIRDGWNKIETAGADVILPRSSESPEQGILGDMHYQRGVELRLLGWQREAAEEFATLTGRIGQERGAVLWLARLLNSTGEYHRALSLVRTFFSEILERGGNAVDRSFWELAYPSGYVPAIQGLPGLNGMDPFLVTAVIREESAYNPIAVSSAGALGLMQVMPQTGQKVAVQVGDGPFTRDRLFEACFNIRVGSWYLRHLIERYGNNLAYSIAAYNAGPDIVSKWVQQFGGKDEDEFIESIPYSETRNYVKRVLRSYAEYKRIYPQDRSTGFLDNPCRAGYSPSQEYHVPQ
jgi:soluble lytic murein transglycosylase